jgi:hypothetical protein
VSFARHGRSQVQSFPSRPAGGIYSASHWKCAADGVDSSRHCGTGMTSVSKRILFQMAPALRGDLSGETGEEIYLACLGRPR